MPQLAVDAVFTSVNGKVFQRDDREALTEY